MQYLQVDDHGTALAYIDNGAPDPHTATGSYITIFAIHGIVFYSPIFDKVMAMAKAAGVRFVALNRRGYPGSTPLPAEEVNTLPSATDEEKSAILQRRGMEIATFIDRFIEQEHLPPISDDGKSGGVAILGWSMGCTYALSALSHIHALPTTTQVRLASYLRSVILQEPPTASLGTPLPPKMWTPHMDTTIPPEQRDAFFMHWASAYFQHGDLSTRDLDAIAYIVPATFRAPSVYSMTQAQLAGMSHEQLSPSPDLLFLIFSSPQLNASYKKACFDKTVRDRLPHLKILHVVGDSTASFSLAAFWAVEEDDRSHGGGFVKFKEIPGGNHFMHWDEPDHALKVYLEACHGYGHESAYRL